MDHVIQILAEIEERKTSWIICDSSYKKYSNFVMNNMATFLLFISWVKNAKWKQINVDRKKLLKNQLNPFHIIN